jgi:hypothetical protein
MLNVAIGHGRFDIVLSGGHTSPAFSEHAAQ